MTDIAELSFRIVTDGLKQGQQELANTAVAARKLEVAESNLAVSTRKLDDINKKLAASTDIVERENLQAAKAAISLRQAQSVQSIAAQKAALATDAVGMASDKAAKASGGFAYKAKQTSMQLSQVASQGAVTGNYLQALAIQLPDLALSFGALGVLVGAAAGSLGVYLVNSLNAASKESGKTSEEIDSLAESFDKLSNAERSAASVKVLSDISDRSAAIMKLKGDYETAVFQVEANTRALERGRITTLEYAAAEKELMASAAILRGELSTAERLLKERKQLLEDLRSGTRRSADEIKNISDKLQDEYDQLTMNNAQLLERDLNQVKATDGEKKAAQAILEKVDALKAEKEAKDKLDQLASGITNVESQLDPNVAVINAAERRLAIIDAANAQDLDNQAKYDALRVSNAQKLSDDLVAIEKRTAEQNSKLLSGQQQATLGATGQFFGNLADIAQAGGEDQFQEYKNLASAQAAISASLAVLSVMGDPLLPTFAKIPLAVSIGALAAVQIAQIQGQEYTSSRASGGQAKGRVLVGENGPEVLNLGSQTGYVSPTTSLDKSNNSNTTVLNISAGVQGTVRSEILSLMPLIMQASVNAAAQSARNGGTMAKAVGLR